MSALKADNDRLQRMMHVRPLNSSQNSIAHNRTSSESLERSLSITEQPSLGKKIRSTLEIQRCRISKCDDKWCYKRVRRSLLITFFFNTNWYWRWFYSVYLIIYQYQRLGHYKYQSDKLFYKADWFEIEKKTMFLILLHFISEMLLSETPDRDGKRVTMTVYLGSNPDPLREGVEVKIVEQIYKNVTEKSLRYRLLIN